MDLGFICVGVLRVLCVLTNPEQGLAPETSADTFGR